MNLKEIALKLDVSMSTVSRVINNKPGVNEKTRALVKEYLEEAGIIKNNENNSIIIIIPDFENPYFGEIIKEASRLLMKEGFQVSIYDTDETLEIERQIIKTILKTGAAGVIFCVSDGHASAKHVEMLQSSNIPVILFDRELEFSIDGVFLNDFQSAFMATEFLIKNNCKKIAILHGPLHLKNVSSRFNGYRYALEKHGMTIDNSIIFGGDMHLDSGYNTMKNIDENNLDIDAILILNNFMTIGALDYVNNNNIGMYKTLKIFGYDIPAYVHSLNPNFNYITRSRKDMGIQIGKMMINKINKVDNHTNTIIIDPILV
ncbi:MAG: LacI family DNA-binding transcriptional regulator [Fusobacteriaceae bacterium]|nr:LacI family DNA-binding transcriptional regulator [Fusobacteriaceae bacterium]